MRKLFIAFAGWLCFGAVLFALLLWCTSASVWYAGEHLEGCTGTDGCGCFEKLIEMEK